MKLRVRDKILLHLLDFYGYRDSDYYAPYEITQAGIAESVGISRTHVPREVKTLISEGYVEEKKGRVLGRKKLVKIYTLTYEGMRKAQKIKDEVLNEYIEIGGERKKVRDLLNERKISLVRFLKDFERGEELEKEKIVKKKYIRMFEIDINVTDFVGRKKEISKIIEWLSEGEGILVIMGLKGIGKSYLVRRVIDILNPELHILWINLYNNRPLESILESFEKFSSLLGVESKDPLKFLHKKKCLIVFDNYHMVTEKTVDFMRNLMNKEVRGHAKIIVTMRSDTPFYNRFYSQEDIVKRKVREITLGPLTMNEVKEMLGSMDYRTLKTIYQLTKGIPLVVKLLKEGDEKTLGEVSTLSREQIKLLMYLVKQGGGV